jgi:MFS family permease
MVMKPSLRTSMLALLAASHGVNDFLAGWLLGGEFPAASAWDRLPWLVIYAALAFAGQLPVAWLMDRSKRQDRWLAGALALMIAAVGAKGFSPGLAVVLSGVASAFCHVAGGALALQLPRGDRAIGWFSAPGILGLTLGGWLGHTQGDLALWAALGPAALLAGWAALRPHWPRAETADGRVAAPGVDAHDGLMLLILLALTLRSALWDLVQVAQLNDPSVVFAIAFSAACGKVAGGWMIARWPTVRQVSLTLLASCLLLDLGRGHLAGLCAGVALLQSTIPASIVLLHRSFGTSAARAAAYGLGLTVALGGLVIPVRVNYVAVLIAVALSALLLLWRGGRRERLSLAG